MSTLSSGSTIGGSVGSDGSVVAVAGSLVPVVLAEPASVVGGATSVAGVGVSSADRLRTPWSTPQAVVARPTATAMAAIRRDGIT